MSGVKDFLFGDPDDKTSMRWQQAANRENQRFAQESTAAARQDLLDLYPRAEENFQQSARAASEISRTAPQAQLRLLARGSEDAQEALLAGSNAFQNAIMGNPTGISANPRNNPRGLQPTALKERAGGVPEYVRAARPFYQSQRPFWMGTQGEDLQEATVRRDGGQFWGHGGGVNQTNLFPEQYREPIRYDYGANVATGGDVQDPASMYAQALSGAVPQGIPGIPNLTWAGRY